MAAGRPPPYVDESGPLTRPPRPAHRYSRAVFLLCREAFGQIDPMAPHRFHPTHVNLEATARPQPPEK